MAAALKSSLEGLGFRVLIQIESEWYSQKGDSYDAVIVFRGLHRYEPKPHQVNVLWNISHPDQVSLDEYESYDHVFIASRFWAEHVAGQISRPVKAVLQCTDPGKFYPPDRHEMAKCRHQLLFVGNSRDVYRKILKDLLPTRYDLSVYGKNWSGLIPEKYIKGSLIRNNLLYRYYGSTDILLNDHWDDMREKGFISNRIFDGLACGAFIISDNVNGLEAEFGQSVQVYHSKNQLKELLDYYTEHQSEAMCKVLPGMRLVRDIHTFDARAKEFAEVIAKLIPLKNK